MKKLVFFFFLCSILSCENDSYSDLIETETTINLKWNKAYADETIDKSLIGLKWALSYVGATLPSSNSGFSNTETTITIDIKKLGLSENSQQKLLKLAEKIKTTSEYQTNNSIDIARLYISLNQCYCWFDILMRLVFFWIISKAFVVRLPKTPIFLYQL